MTIELIKKACPYCNGTNSVVIRPDYPGNIDMYFVRCKHCRMCGPEASSEFFAISAWSELPRIEGGRQYD